MCGIAGILGGGGIAVERAVRGMTRAMIHRGPDDEGSEQFPLGDSADGAVCGFGFRRLAIMDLPPLGRSQAVRANGSTPVPSVVARRASAAIGGFRRWSGRPHRRRKRPVQRKEFAIVSAGRRGVAVRQSVHFPRGLVAP